MLIQNLYEKDIWKTSFRFPLSQKAKKYKGLFVMVIAPISHWNFLTTLAFLECFYTVLMNKKQVLEESEDLL